MFAMLRGLGGGDLDEGLEVRGGRCRLLSVLSELAAEPFSRFDCCSRLGLANREVGLESADPLVCGLARRRAGAARVVDFAFQLAGAVAVSGRFGDSRVEERLEIAGGLGRLARLLFELGAQAIGELALPLCVLLRHVEISLELSGALAVLAGFCRRGIDEGLKFGRGNRCALCLLREFGLEPFGRLVRSSALGLGRREHRFQPARALGGCSLGVGCACACVLQLVFEPLGPVAMLGLLSAGDVETRLEVRGDVGGLVGVTRELRLEIVDTGPCGRFRLCGGTAEGLGVRPGPVEFGRELVGPLALLPRLRVGDVNESLSLLELAAKPARGGAQSVQLLRSIVLGGQLTLEPICPVALSPSLVRGTLDLRP